MVEECFENIFDSYQKTVRIAEKLLLEEDDLDKVEQNFQCGSCAQILLSQGEANAHVENNHEEEKCVICVKHMKEKK